MAWNKLGSIPDFLQHALFAPSLGHGRMIETYLAAVCGVYGIILLFPDAAATSQATRDVFFADVGWLLALPFLLKAALSGYGVLSNIHDWKYSFETRMLGALLGVSLFAWYAAKFFFIGAVASVGFPFCFVAIFCCIRVMILASLGLPVPGAKGRV